MKKINKINKIIAEIYARRAIRYARRLASKSINPFFELIRIEFRPWKAHVKIVVAYTYTKKTILYEKDWKHEVIKRYETSQDFTYYQEPREMRFIYNRFKKDLRDQAERSGKLKK